MFVIYYIELYTSHHLQLFYLNVLLVRFSNI